MSNKYEDSRNKIGRTRMKRILAALSITGLLVLGVASLAQAVDTPTITVDGVSYAATQISGDVWHFETPDTNPTQAWTSRHTWTGNGSDNLPCPGGIHWIDNANLLTVSHCLPETTTTTSTTTTSQPSTTTTPTSTTYATTTTVPTTTSTETSTTTTSLPVTTSTLPFTGMSAGTAKLAGWGALLLLGGLGLLLIEKGDYE